VLLGWLRFVCSNGLIVGETMAEIRDVHDARLNLDQVRLVIAKGLRMVDRDFARIQSWAASDVTSAAIGAWVDGSVSESWGKKAASRVLHICASGVDSEWTNAFAQGPASAKPVRLTEPVPGSEVPAKTLYGVSQALSWVASRRSSAEERVLWQSQVPQLLSMLKATL